MNENTSAPEELKPHSKVGIEQTGQPIHCRAAHVLDGNAPLSHLLAEIFKDSRKNRRLMGAITKNLLKQRRKESAAQTA